ncbi:hypothetical protein GF327_02905 [Candidatus Woesearchaeota archaeon]|nr:hypothetical protein [Candidatus Woesearchaeota archaeon]
MRFNIYLLKIKRLFIFLHLKLDSKGLSPDYDDLKAVDIDDSFSMPPIDGFNPSTELMSIQAGDDDLPYQAKIGTWHYRKGLNVSSGGKSGFPDWAFFPDGFGKYYQVIAIPGHYSLEKVNSNLSIGPLPDPDSIIYLVDPKIRDFDHDLNEKRKKRGNPALRNCHIHLEDILKAEKKGIPVNWYLSKTRKSEAEYSKSESLRIYSPDKKTEFGREVIAQNFSKLLGLEEIAERILKLDYFDSKKSSNSVIEAVLKKAGIELTSY